MKDLIAKLEAATGPSREMDAEIAEAVSARFGKFGYADEETETARYYTSSIDASLTLVPAEHDWSIFADNGAAIAGCKPASDDGCDIADCHGATLAIALCIAALRARDGGRG